MGLSVLMWRINCWGAPRSNVLDGFGSFIGGILVSAPSIRPSADGLLDRKHRSLAALWASGEWMRRQGKTDSTRRNLFDRRAFAFGREQTSDDIGWPQCLPARMRRWHCRDRRAVLPRQGCGRWLVCPSALQRTILGAEGNIVLMTDKRADRNNG